jgi:hypothetical protein
MKYRASTTYFLTEGRGNLAECLRLSFDKARETGIQIIVMYTANGEGLELACKKFLVQPKYSSIRLVGVSVPIGSAPTEALMIPEARRDLLTRHDIPIIRAANPFEDAQVPNVPGPNLVRRAFECFSGGTAVCISSAVIACDAGLVAPGAHVITMSADTSLLLKVLPSSHALSALVVREIICKPTILDISKKEIVAAEVNTEALLNRRKNKVRALPPTGDSEQTNH